jgi:cobalamin biosynthesis protein CobD/CbiB
MIHTTLPKVDKVNTSSPEAPMTQALVVRLGSKASYGTLADDDPDLLNSTTVES